MTLTLPERLSTWGLDEDKKVHSHPHLKAQKTAHAAGSARAHAALVKKDITAWRDRKSSLSSAAKVQYERIKREFRTALRDAVFGYLDGRHTDKEMVVRSRAAFDDAYGRTLRLGLKASGVPALDLSGKSSTYGPSVRPADAEWLKSSLAAERRYWHGFLDDVRARRFPRFTPGQRVDMYVDTLDHVFEVGRVVGHPRHSVIFWVLGKDCDHCEKCLWLRDNGPYTRETIPGVPRDGHTCFGISRCGCNLRFVTGEDDTRWRKASKRSRADLVRKLAAVGRKK